MKKNWKLHSSLKLAITSIKNIAKAQIKLAMKQKSVMKSILEVKILFPPLKILLFLRLSLMMKKTIQQQQLIKSKD